MWASSAVGSAREWHSRGHRFDPGLVHHPSLAYGELRLGKPSESLIGRRMPRRSGEAAKAGLNELRFGKPNAPRSRRRRYCAPPISSGARKLPLQFFVGSDQAYSEGSEEAFGLPSGSGMPAEKHVVYVLKNQDANPRFYVGLTSDVHARLEDHNAGRSTYGEVPALAVACHHRVAERTAGSSLRAIPEVWLG